MKPTPERLKALLDVTIKDVANLGSAQRNNVLAVLMLAEAELSKSLKEWRKKVQNGEDRFTHKHLRTTLLQTKTAIDLIKTAGVELERNLKNGNTEAFSLAIKHTEMEFYGLNDAYGVPFRPINIDLAATIVTEQKLVMDRFRKYSKKYTSDMESHIKKNLAIGVIKGETIDQLVKRLMRNTGDMGKGLMKLPKASADRIIRTELLNAYNEKHNDSIKVLAEVHDDIKKRWDASLDRRVCELCRSLEGQVVDPDGNFSGGINHPPAHPNCRCTVVTWSAFWEE